MATTIVFVHGYSVTNLNTYGELPIRLREEAKQAGLNIQVEEIFLGRYISFNDDVRLNDISRAFKTAVNEQLSDMLNAGNRFVCITHSTGGPVIRNWWSRYCKNSDKPCPMSHLIMLAPANFGSALAQLGKGKLSRLKSWFDGVEPGQGVLNWLELGSAEAWELNKEWIISNGKQIGSDGIFPFVLAGQTIDRKLFDHLNTYTGELGSDGVVRVATTNLNARYIKLMQPIPTKNENGFEVIEYNQAPATATRVISGKSHSGDDIGIMKSVKKELSDSDSSETLKAIINCIRVTNNAQYNALTLQFINETEQVQQQELVETEKEIFLKERDFIHDKFSQVIFRVRDTEGYPVTDYDLILTAGPQNDANHLPEDFVVDKQKNYVTPETLTYFFNYNIMNGFPAIKNSKGEIIRDAIEKTESMGLEIYPRPDNGFMRYLPYKIKANADLLQKALSPNNTTLIDIVMQRIVSKEVFRLTKVGDSMPTTNEGDFKDVEPGNEIVE